MFGIESSSYRKWNPICVYSAKEKKAEVCSLPTKSRSTFWLGTKPAEAIPSIADTTGEEGRSNRVLQQTPSSVMQPCRSLPSLWSSSLAQLGIAVAQLIHGTFTSSSFPLFQGEAHRKLWLLSPLSATGQRARAEEQHVPLPCTSSLPSSARTSPHIHISPHTGLLPQLTVNSSKVLPLTPSDVRSSFWGRDMFVAAGRGNEALPGCVPQWDIVTTSFHWHFSRHYIKLFSHFWTILLQSKREGTWLLGAGPTWLSPSGDLNPSLFWPECPGKRNKCKRAVW